MGSIHSSLKEVSEDVIRPKIACTCNSFTWNSTEQMLNGFNQAGLLDTTGDDYHSVNIYMTLPILVIHLLMSLFFGVNATWEAPNDPRS